MPESNDLSEIVPLSESDMPSSAVPRTEGGRKSDEASSATLLVSEHEPSSPPFGSPHLGSSACALLRSSSQPLHPSEVLGVGVSATSVPAALSVCATSSVE